MSDVKELKYTLTKKQRYYYSSVLLMEDMNNFNKKYSVNLEGDDSFLEDLFVHMMSNGWIIIDSNNDYSVTDDGRKVLVNYLSKLTEFRSMFKVYSAVDTGEGIFGYSSYFDFDTDEQFMMFIEKDNFEDLRVAVCEMKKINPLDVIFLEFVDNGKYDFEFSGWQLDLVSGLIWDEMLEVANTNIHIDDLSEYDDDGNLTSTGEEVMSIIINGGMDVMIDIMSQQSELDEEEEEDIIEDEYIIEEYTDEYYTDEYYIEEPYFGIDYYDSYYDPYYISPCWGYDYY